MLASNRDEWVNRLNEEWNDQLNLAKNNAPTDEMCKLLLFSVYEKNDISFV